MSTAVESIPEAAAPVGAPTDISLKTLLTLAWPIILSRSTQVIIGLTDALMVAPLGEEALAATTTGAFDAFSLLILPMGICFIVSSFSSQLFGAGDKIGARRYGFYGLAVAVIAQLICVALWPASPFLLGLLPYSPHVRDLMAGYLAIRLLAGGPAIGIEALSNYYGGLGNTRLPMLINVLAMVLNVLGCWLFIGGHWGAPALGVRGSALAAGVATTIAFAIFLTVFLREGQKDGAIFPKLSFAELRRMLRFGLPSGFNWFFEFFAFFFFINVVMAGLGTTALAAMMAVFQINSVSFMPGFGLASAGAILVGQAIGAKRLDDVNRAVKLSFLSSASWQLFVSVIYLTLPAVLLLPFVRNESESAGFLAAGKRIVMLSAAWQLFDAAATNLGETLRAAGDTAFTLKARTIIAWGVFVPCSYASVKWFGFGDVGAVFWVAVYLGLLAITLFIRFRRGAWRDISLVHD
ncbi:MAG: MATE family efflux transporter [Myxococcaceae bacterium]